VLNGEKFVTPGYSCCQYNNLKILPINAVMTISWADTLGINGVPLA